MHSAEHRQMGHKDRMLDHGDLIHYRSMVAALGDTSRFMAEADETIEAAGTRPLT